MNPATDCCICAARGAQNAVFATLTGTRLKSIARTTWNGRAVEMYQLADTSTDAFLNTIATHVMARDVHGPAVIRGANAQDVVASMNRRAPRSWATIASELPKTFTDTAVRDRLEREQAEQCAKWDSYIDRKRARALATDEPYEASDSD